MQPQRNPRRTVSGNVYVHEGVKGRVWRWRIRLPNGSEERRAIGPEWVGGGRTPAGYFTRRSAEAALAARLTDLRRGVGIPARTGATFKDAAEAWYTHGTTDANWKPSTRRDYRSALDRHLLPAFGDWNLEAVTGEAIEKWRTTEMDAGRVPRRTAAKLHAILHAIFKRAHKLYGLTVNPADDVEPIRVRYDAADYSFYSPEQVLALVRETEHPAPGEDGETANGSRQDAALFLTAAFAGLRLGELLALRVRDIDFPAVSIRVMGSYDYRAGTVGTTKGGRGRTVPMVEQVAQTLARLLDREHFTGDDDLVFPGETGGHLDGSALRRRYRAAQTRAKLPAIRLHDLRHTFGSLAITNASPIEVQQWLGHADGRTTARYMHYKPRSDEARRLGAAFQPAQVEQVDALDTVPKEATR